ncbi:MAG: transporter substrate-binding domain-containing protein [Spirulina sp. SIO3F2]|nr:transporter substrate-binding domain-containing protein [Spirulina sp. SIO3F2]
MDRRFFMQAGVGLTLALIAQSCGTSKNNSSDLDISPSLLKKINQKGFLLVATEDDYPPFEFLVNGEPTGFDHELLELLRAKVDFEIQQEIMPWQGLLPGVAEGKYDVALSAAIITDERIQTLDFTMPIAESTIAYAKRKEDSSIQAIADLSGKALGVQAGGASLEAVADLEATLKAAGGELGEVIEYGNFTEAYQGLVEQQVDVVLNNIVSLSVLVDEKPAIFALGERVSPKAYAAWAVQRGNQELLDFLNQFLAAVRETGELQQLQEKWLKITFEDLPTVPLLPGERPIER